MARVAPNTSGDSTVAAISAKHVPDSVDDDLRLVEWNPVPAVRGNDVPARAGEAGECLLLSHSVAAGIGRRDGDDRQVAIAVRRRLERLGGARRIDWIWLPSASKNFSWVQNCRSGFRVSSGSFQSGARMPSSSRDSPPRLAIFASARATPNSPSVTSPLTRRAAPKRAALAPLRHSRKPRSIFSCSLGAGVTQSSG